MGRHIDHGTRTKTGNGIRTKADLKRIKGEKESADGKARAALAELQDEFTVESKRRAAVDEDQFKRLNEIRGKCPHLKTTYTDGGMCEPGETTCDLCGERVPEKKPAGSATYVPGIRVIADRKQL